jgi:hypothetical protein
MLAVTDPVLDQRGKLPEARAEMWDDKERVIPEASGTGGSPGDRALANTSVDGLDTLGKNEGDDTDVARRTWVRDLGERIEETPVVRVVEFLARQVHAAGEAFGEDPGSAVEGIHAEAGIVRQDGKVRMEMKPTRLGQRVLLERLEGLDRLLLGRPLDAGVSRVDQMKARDRGDELSDLAQFMEVTGRHDDEDLIHW